MIGRDGKPVCRAKVVQWDHEALAADRDSLGLRGSPTRVKVIESVVLAQSATAHGGAQTRRRGHARARAHRGAHPWLGQPESGGAGAPCSGARRDVWVVVEADDGAPPTSASSFSAARASSPTSSACRSAPCWPAAGAPRALAPALVARGADTVYVADHEALAHYLAPPYTRRQPTWCASTGRRSSSSAPPRPAATWPRASPATLKAGLTADCTDLRIGDHHEPGGADYKDLLYQIRPAFGGNIIATIVCPEHRPQMATVREGVMSDAGARRGAHRHRLKSPVERSSAAVADAGRIVLTDWRSSSPGAPRPGGEEGQPQGRPRRRLRRRRRRLAARVSRCSTNSPHARRRRRRLARRRGRGLDRAGAPGRPDRHHGAAQALHRLRHLRLRAAPRRHGSVAPDPGDQHRSAGADLRRRPLRYRRRPARGHPPSHQGLPHQGRGRRGGGGRRRDLGRRR